MRTPWSDRSPWESQISYTQRVKDKEEEKRKLAIIKQLNDQAKTSGIGYQSPQMRALRDEYQNIHNANNRRYRGILSGAHAYGLHEAGENVSAPLQMQEGVELPTDDGFNPFKAIGTGVMNTLGAWQNLTEWTAGQVSTPFSRQVQTHRARGLSAGEAWRRSEFATTRIGREKGEGFGFNLGVKGGVELLVDPIGWATMAIPLGAIVRPVAKLSSKMVSVLPGVRTVRRLGQESLEKGRDFDKILKNLNLSKQNAKAFEKSLHKGTLSQKDIDNYIKYGFRMKNGERIPVKEVGNRVPINTQILDIANYDHMLELHGVNNEGLIADLLRFSNSDSAKNLSAWKGRHFFLGLKNAHKLWNQAFNKAATVEGRASLAYNWDATMGDGIWNTALSPFRQKGHTFDDAFGSVEVEIEKDLGDGFIRNVKNAFVRMKIRQEKTAADPSTGFQRALFGKGQKRLKKSPAKVEVRTTFNPDTGEFVVYSVNNQIKMVGNITDYNNKFTQDLVDKSGWLDAEGLVLSQDLDNAGRRYSNYKQKQSKGKEFKPDTWTELGREPGKGLRHKVGTANIQKVETYAMDLPKDVSDYLANSITSKKTSGLQRAIESLTDAENALTIFAKSRKIQRTSVQRRALDRTRRQALDDVNAQFGKLYDDAFKQSRFKKNFRFKPQIIDDVPAKETKTLYNQKLKPIQGGEEGFATADEAKAAIFNSYQGVKAGKTTVGGKFRSPVTDAASANSQLMTVMKGLKNNKLIHSVTSKKKLKGDGFAEVGLEGVDVMPSIMRNLKRRIDQSGVIKKGAKPVDMITWTDDVGRMQYYHFGDAFANLDKKSWSAVKGMGVVTEKFAKKLEKEYPDLVKGTGLGSEEIVMSSADMLDLGGYIIGYNPATERPMRLYEEFFDLDKRQLDWLSSYYNLYDEGAALLRYKGVPPENLFEDTTGNYVHHLLDNFGDVQQLVDDQSIARASSGALRPTSYRHQRIWSSIQEATEEAGFQYNTDPIQVAEAFLRGVYKDLADKQYINRLSVISDKQLRNKNIRIGELKKFTSRKVELQKTVDKLGKVRGAVGLGLGDDITKLDNVMREAGIDHIATGNDPRSWNTVKKTLDSLMKDDADADQIKNILQPFLDDAELAYTKELDKVKLAVEGFNRRGGVKTSSKVRKLTGLWGKEAVAMRQVIDQRSTFNMPVKALKDEHMFFNEKTASKLEAELGIGKEIAGYDKFIKEVADINDFVRVVQTGWDAGTAFLHGLPTLMRGISSIPASAITGKGNPYLKAWTKGTKDMVQMIYYGKDAPQYHAKLIAGKIENFRQMANYGVLISGAGSDYFRARGNASIINRIIREGRVNTRQARDAIPGFSQARGKIQYFSGKLDGFQAGFESFGDSIRESLWEAHFNQIMKSGAIDKEAQLAQLADYVNGMTGAFSSKRAGIATRQQNLESSILFFSPSYTRATLGLVGSVYSGGLQGIEATKSVRAMMAAGVGTHIMFAGLKAQAEGKDWDEYIRLDPANSEFLSLELNGVKVGFGSAWMSLARTTGKILNDPAFRGDVLDSPLLLSGAGRGQAGFDEQGIKNTLSNNQLLYWLRSRSSPVGSTMWDLGMGADFLGEEMKPFGKKFFTDLPDSVMPFWAESALENGILGGDLAAGAVAGATEFVGLRGTPVSDWERRREVRDMLGQQYFEKSWRDLNDLERRFIEESDTIEDDPNRQRLGELHDKIREERRIVGGGELDREIDEYTYAISDYREQYKDKVAETVSQLTGGEISLEQYKVIEQKARSNYGRRVQSLQEDSRYTKVEAYFESQKGRMGSNERFEDIAADEFMEIYFDEEYDMEFMYDFAAREAAIDNWRGRWGTEYEEYAREKLFGRRWDLNGFNMEFYRRREEFMPQYMEETRKQIFQQRYQGQLDEAYNQWYLAKYNDAKRKQIEEANPRFKTALNQWETLREELRKLNPELDAFLYRWGYAESLLHPWNRGREQELKSAFPFEEYIPKWKVAGQ